MTTERTPTANRRLAQWRMTWLIQHSTSHQLLWCIDSFELRNSPLRQAPKRYENSIRAVKSAITSLEPVVVKSTCFFRK